MRRVLRASDRALLVEEADLGTSMRVHAALAAELEAGGLVGVTELIPAARTSSSVSSRSWNVRVVMTLP